MSRARKTWFALLALLGLVAAVPSVAAEHSDDDGAYSLVDCIASFTTMPLNPCVDRPEGLQDLFIERLAEEATECQEALDPESPECIR